MLEGFSSNATVAKIRSVHGKMLTAENYHEMISRRSVAEVAEYVKRCPRFKETMRDVDANTVHRGFLETLLRKADFDTYARLCSFQGLDKTPFYNFIIRRLEFEQLLNLVNAVNSGLDRKFIDELPGYVIRHSQLDLLKLSQAGDFGEILSALKGTPYLKVMKSVRVLENGKADFTDCELKLRSFYYKRLISAAEKDLSGADAAEIKKIVCTETDIINIINAYRLKAYFGYSPQQIKARQLPFTRLGKHAMDRLYESETPQELIERLEKTVYGRFFQGDYEHIETKVNLYICRLMEHTVACTTSAPVAIYAFMRLCRIETENIIHIIEGVRYDVDPAVIEKLIVNCAVQR